MRLIALRSIASREHEVPAAAGIFPLSKRRKQQLARADLPVRQLSRYARGRQPRRDAIHRRAQAALSSETTLPN